MFVKCSQVYRTFGKWKKRANQSSNFAINTFELKFFYPHKLKKFLKKM